MSDHDCRPALPRAFWIGMAWVLVFYVVIGLLVWKFCF